MPHVDGRAVEAYLDLPQQPELRTQVEHPHGSDLASTHPDTGLTSVIPILRRYCDIPASCFVRLPGRAGGSSPATPQGGLGRGRVFAHDLAGTTQQPVLAAFIRAVAADRSAINLREEDLLEAVDIMERAVSDAVGADLRDADLTGIPLRGVRWSKTTVWPPAWRDQVRRGSTQIGPDLWEIDHGGVDAEHLVTTR
jgi:hypothetical protein